MTYEYTAYITFPDEETRVVKSNNLRDLALKCGVSTSTLVRIIKTDSPHSRLRRSLKLERNERLKKGIKE